MVGHALDSSPTVTGHPCVVTQTVLFVIVAGCYRLRRLSICLSGGRIIITILRLGTGPRADDTNAVPAHAVQHFVCLPVRSF